MSRDANENFRELDCLPPSLGAEDSPITGQGPSREDPQCSGFSTYFVHRPLWAKWAG